MGRLGFVLIGVATVTLLSSCGGSSSGSVDQTPPLTISGIAAAGAPVSGTVKIKDATGTEKSVVIGSGGSFTVDTAGMTAPFILMAEGTVSGRAYSLTSPATSSDIGGTVNITPLTNVILGNVMRQNGETAYESDDFVLYIIDTTIYAQETLLSTTLAGILTDAGFDRLSKSIINTSFPADHTGIDLAMDMLSVDVDKTTNIAKISLVDGSATVLDDLTSPVPVSALSPTGNQTTSIDEYNDILSVINNFVNDLNSGTAAGTAVILTPKYFTSTFLDDGVDSAIFLSNLGVGFPSQPVLSMNDIAITSLDLTAVLKKAVIRFMVSFNGVLYGSAEMQLLKDTANADIWLLDGNQMLADINLRSYVEEISTYQRSTGSETTVYNTGLHLSMDISDAYDNSINNGITQATLAGPGIAVPVILTPHTNLLVRFVNGVTWDGYIPLSDFDIGMISEGDLYTLAVGYNAGTANYQLRLNKPPMTNVQASSQSFTAITNPASANALDGQYDNISVAWTLGNELTPFDIDARSTCGVIGGFGATNTIVSSSSPELMTMTDYRSINSCEGILRLRSLDKFNSEFITTYKIVN